VIHALQWLPLLAWAARRASLSEPARLRLVTVATLGTAFLGAYALVQTLAGRSRFDITPGTGALFAGGAACLGLPAVIAAWAWLRQVQTGSISRQ
jgi:hypothetical protein